MPLDLINGIVRILTPNDDTVGTGFILTNDGLIATCAHVITKAGAEPGEIVRLTFHATGNEATATVEPDGWREVDAEDVAILRLLKPLPQKVIPLAFGSVVNLANCQFQTLGFPEANPKGGLLGRGHILGRVDLNGVSVWQISSQEVTGGFSGAPVWVPALRQVVGLVTATAEPDDRGRLRDTAFITPIDSIIAACPDLEQVRQDSAAALLHQFIIQYYSLTQLQDLCLALEVPYDDLTGVRISDKVRKLLFWIAQEQFLEQLLTHLEKIRPTQFTEAGLNLASPFMKRLYQELVPERQYTPSRRGVYTVNPPNPPRRFTGRRPLLDKIKGPLTKDQDKPPIIGIFGMAGVGKTAFTLQLAYELKSYFTGGIFWSPLSEREDTARLILTAWGRACQPNFIADRDTEALIASVHKLLETRKAQKGPILVIIDNVRADWLEVANQLKQAIPISFPILITVRNQKIAVKFEARTYRLNVLPPSEALEMFKLYYDPEKNKTENENTKSFLKAIGYLPLAIELAGTYLAGLSDRPGSRITELLRAVKDEALQTRDKQGINRVFGNEKLHLPSEVQDRLYTQFSLSYQQLQPEFQRLFRYLSVFVPGPIRSSSIATVTGLSQEKTEKHLDRLALFSLLEWDSTEDKSSQRCVFHTLLRRYAQFLLVQAGERVEAKTAHLKYYLTFAQNNAKVDLAAHDELEATLPNILAAFRYAIQQKNHSAIRQFGLTLYIESDFLEMRGYTEEAKEILQKSVEACEQLDDPHNQARFLGSLGKVHESLGQIQKAIEYYDNALKLGQQLNQPLEEGVWLDYLGIAHRKLGEVDKAIDYHLQALEIYRREGDQRREGLGLGNLGTIYGDQGQAEKAIDYYTQALDIAIEKNDPKGKALWRDRLGLAYRHMGDVSEAITSFEAALEIHRQRSDLRGEAGTLSDLGLCYYNRGQIEIATNYFEQGLDLSRKLKHQLSEAVALGNLGLAYRHRGLIQEAIEYFEQALSIYRQFGDQRQEGNVLANLGIAHRYLSENKQAIELHQQALDIRRKIGDRRGEGASLGNLAHSYLNLGQANRAIEYFKEALAISRETGERRSEGNALANLGRAYRHQGQIIRALEYYAQALTISQEIGHRRSEANRLGRLGNTYRKLGQLDRAIEFLHEALTITREIEDYRGEEDILGYLSLVYRAEEKFEVAINYAKQAIEISRKIGNRRKEGIWLGHLGVIYYLQEVLDEAENCQKQALEITKSVANRRHEGNHLGNLGLIYGHRGQFDKAIEYYQKALKLHQKIGDQLKVSTSFVNLGNVYRNSRKVDEAINFYTQAISLNHEIDYAQGEGEALVNLSQAYLDIGKVDSAKRCLEQALAINQQFNPRRDLIY